MTRTEEAIYASVWSAKYLEQIKPDAIPKSVIMPGQLDRWERYEVDAAVSAVEAASHAVCRFRELGPRLLEGWSESAVTLQLYREACQK